MAFEPKFRFRDKQEYGERLREATTVDYDEEQARIQEFNEKKHSFHAYVIQKMQPVNLSSYLFRGRIHGYPMLPKAGERFIFQSSLTGCKEFTATRTPDLVPLSKDWENYTEFRVDFDKKAEELLTKSLEPLLPLLSTEASDLKLPPKYHLRFILTLRCSKTTIRAHLGALRTCMSAPSNSNLGKAFHYLLNFSQPRSFTNLFETFPHLNNTEAFSNKAQELRSSFNRQQEAALQGLAKIPHSLYFLPGGPGAGKTRFCLALAAFIQSGPAPARVLYLLDINKPLDDTADKMARMYQDLEMQKTAIRMRGWPEELRKRVTAGNEVPGETQPTSQATHGADGPRSTACHNDESEQRGSEPSALMRALTRELRRCRARAPDCDPAYSQALTLDEAASQLFHSRRQVLPTGYWQLVMDLMHGTHTVPGTGSQNQCDWHDINHAVFGLYKEVLLKADFIATTPVAAIEHADALGDFDLVIFDESAQARELSTLISLSSFTPKAWIFTGDHRQTNPSRRSDSDEVTKQLTMSLMERAGKCEGIKMELLLNHRAFGGLERLSSKLFYEGKMKSAREPTNELPASVIHLQQYLKTRAGGKPVDVPRLVVDIKSAEEREDESSYWNPQHLGWVLETVRDLVQDPHFLQSDGKTPGTILIISPYRESNFQYNKALKQHLPNIFYSQRVQSRTLVTGQGNEADFIFLDLVREKATPFIDDGKRLCVALSRAKQAEIVLMPGQLLVGVPHQGYRPAWLPKIKTECKEFGQGTCIEVESYTPSKWIHQTLRCEM